MKIYGDDAQRNLSIDQSSNQSVDKPVHQSKIRHSPKREVTSGLRVQQFTNVKMR